MPRKIAALAPQRGLYTLTGTTLAGDRSLAFLKEIKGGKARTVKQGDNIGGVLVAEVKPNGPADKAGFKSGDVVIEFNGKPVTDKRQLQLLVAQVKPGKTVSAKVLRDGATKTLEVTTKELPSGDRLAKAGSHEHN